MSQCLFRRASEPLQDELRAEAKSLDAARRKRERDLSRVQKQVAKLQQLETDLIERMREV
ncbi:MAG: hypothetical protein KDA80_06890 [Planctomycetaceae bacterium]|nr:hypothetical protein [Planctomycetaceae bacterium]